jgi:TrmH family RNA methyltransferase
MLRQLTSLQHPLVKHLVKLRQNRDYRYEHQSLIIEGIKPITELCRCSYFRTLIAWDETLLPKEAKANEIFIVNENVMKKLSGMQTPEGLLAEIIMPKSASLVGLKRLIAFDRINDPGNLGTLLRTALALGWDGAFILEDSCDPFNEKAVRAARGATFHLPLAWGNWEQLKKLVYDNHLDPLVADPKGQELGTIEAKDGILLVFGNEAKGASNEGKGFCQGVSIPMPGQMESLNVAVAGGIMMYALRKNSIPNHTQKI